MHGGFSCMKKKITYIIYFFIMVLCCSLLFGCNKTGKEGTGTFPAKTEIEKIGILTAEENPLNIYAIRWPEKYYEGNDVIEFNTDTSALTEDDRVFLLSFAEKHRGDAAGEVLLCRVDIHILENGAHTYTGFEIYDEYPEDFDKFVEIINRICGSDKEYLCMNGKVQEITPEYVTAISGVDDDMVQGGTVKDIIELYDINDIDTLQRYQRGWDIDMFAENYSLISILPFEVKSATSTDDECYDYACRLAQKLGVNSQVVKEYSKHGDDQEWYQINDFKDRSIRVYRTCLVKNDIIDKRDDYECYRLSEYTPDYDTFEVPCPDIRDDYDFIYSNDYKFAIAVEDIDINPYGSDNEIIIFKEIAMAVADIDSDEELVFETGYNPVITSVEQDESNAAKVSFKYKYGDGYRNGEVIDKHYFPGDEFVEQACVRELDLDNDGSNEIIIKVNYVEDFGYRIFLGSIHILKITDSGDYEEVADQDYYLNTLEENRIGALIIQDDNLYFMMASVETLENLPMPCDTDTFRSLCTYYRIYIEGDEVKEEQVDLKISEYAKIF